MSVRRPPNPERHITVNTEEQAEENQSRCLLHVHLPIMYQFFIGEQDGEGDMETH